MATTWTNWCFLCAAEANCKNSLFEKDENGNILANKISNYFSILTSPNDGMPQFICNECFQYLEGVEEFAKRFSRAHAMFLDLKECASSRDAQKIRRNYKFNKGEVDSSDETSDSNDNYVDEFNNVEEEEIELNLLKLEITVDETQARLQLANSKSTGKPVKTCPHCSRCFKSDLPYRKHLKYVHQIKVEMETLNPEKHIDPKQMILSQCTICDKQFRSPNNLKLHLRVVHLNDRPFMCEDCGKAFTTVYKLDEHKTIHSDERKYTCDVCQKSFKNRTRLRVHKDTHSSTVYFCPVCGLKLNTLKTLNNHKLVHSDVKKFQCTICDSSFKRRSNYKQHLRFKHSSNSGTANKNVESNLAEKTSID